MDTGLRPVPRKKSRSERLVVPVAALLLGMLLGINLSPANGEAQEPSDRRQSPVHVTPQPAYLASPDPSQASAGSDPVAAAGQSALSAGRIARNIDGIPFSLVLPKGWESFIPNHVSKSRIGPQGAEAVLFWTGYPNPAHADRCESMLGRGAGPTGADLLDAVTSAPGIDVIANPSTITVGGRTAKKVTLAVTADHGCDPGYFFLWAWELRGAFWAETQVGDTIEIWVIDIDGAIVVFESEMHPDAGSSLAQEVREIVKSIEFN